jgi:hypothetical protein
LLTPFVVIAGWKVIEVKPAQYFAAFLMLEGMMIGVFAALDGLLFYVFWEAMLIPMFIIIGIWGGERRVYATIKFFLYTFLGSVFMLIALIYLYMQSGGYSILGFHALPLGALEQTLIFLAFFAAFAVKVPMWPVHTWLPDAHVEAPTGGSVILAAILLKMGGYGFLRFSSADHTGCQPEPGLAGDYTVSGGDRLYRVCCHRAARHEETDCVFIDCPYGVCDAGLFRDLHDRRQRRQRRGAGAAWRHDSDDLARTDFRRAVFVRGRDV